MISVTGTVRIIKPVFRSQMINIKTTLHISCYNNNSLANEKTIQLMVVVMDFSGCSIHHAFLESHGFVHATSYMTYVGSDSL